MKRQLVAAAAGLVLAFAAATAATASPPPPAGPACASPQFFMNNLNGLVTHFYSHGGYYTSPSSGHTSFCMVWKGQSLDGFVNVYQIEADGGAGSGNCLANPTWTITTLQGCQKGKLTQAYIDTLYPDDTPGAGGQGNVFSLAWAGRILSATKVNGKWTWDPGGTEGNAQIIEYQLG